LFVLNVLAVCGSIFAICDIALSINDTFGSIVLAICAISCAGANGVLFTIFCISLALVAVLACCTHLPVNPTHTKFSIKSAAHNKASISLANAGFCSANSLYFSSHSHNITSHCLAASVSHILDNKALPAHHIA
jgi:hypothetical protein